jgi:hypothetical protein
VILLTAAIGLCAGLGRVAAQQKPSAEVLLPYFEVEAQADGTTTMLAVANALDQPVDIQIDLNSNWGIVIYTTPLTLAAHEVRTFNLRAWMNGQMPGNTLSGVDLAHLQAALSGQRSPKDNLYYSSPVTGRFTGFVRIVTQSLSRPAALWGDYFFLDSAGNITYASDLVNLDTETGCPGLCKRHALRFLAGTPFDGGTRVMVWTGRPGQPAVSPNPGSLVSQADTTIFEESGTPLGSSQNSLLSAQSLTLADLGVHQPFGSLDLKTGSEVFIAVQYGASNGLSLGVQAYCLPELPPSATPVGPGIRLRKLTNGADANDAPGPLIRVGDPVLWEYVVENTGGVKLTDVKVSDDQGEQVSCPATTLDPGASMTCTAHGTAAACQYTNLGTVTARDPDGNEVAASDPSHYFGDQNPAIAIELLTNGQHATAAPGPNLPVGSPVAWTYRVTNTGDVYLTDVKVTDDKGSAVTCPKASLSPGETMTCAGTGVAVAGPYKSTGTATASSSCGVTVSSHDDSHYYGETPLSACIQIKKFTNGMDADAAPGPHIQVGSPIAWDYVVTNPCQAALSSVNVTDNRGVAVSCPKTSLASGETMHCTGNGTATAGQYENIGTVTANPPTGPAVTSSDSSHYYGDTPESPSACIRIKKFTNGMDADVAPGPHLQVGDPVTWDYVVTNPCQAALSNINVTDDQGVAVSCPKTSLASGEAMHCTGNGTATEGQYENTGTVTANPPTGPAVTDSDLSHYYGVPPEPPSACIQIKKFTNGMDADVAPGPHLQVGDPVTWDYVVTNPCKAALSNVNVTDDRGVAVSCPKTSLASGEVMHFAGNGTATEGQYENTGTVTANPPTGPAVTDSDLSHYYGILPEPPSACIQIKKFTNGMDADVAPGPHIQVGSPIVWDYVVTNPCKATLSSIYVSDNRGVAVSCPKTSLVSGEVMHCTGNGTATEGQYENIGTVTANPPSGPAVTDSDSSHYYGDAPPPPSACIRIKKFTNGMDADVAPGPHIQVGSLVAWDYVVTNPCQAALSNVNVTDNRGVAVSCPTATLASGEVMHCTGHGTATAGQYENIGTVTADPPTGPAVTSSDSSHYYGDTPPPPSACIRIKKFTNGEDADVAPGPHIQVGSLVAWDYVVTNPCQAALSNVYVTDNRGVAVSCPKASLASGEVMYCTGNGTATAGQYENIGTVTANPPSGPAVTASDPSHYYGDAPVCGKEIRDAGSGLDSQGRDTTLDLSSALDADQSLESPLR